MSAGRLDTAELRQAAATLHSHAAALSDRLAALTATESESAIPASCPLAGRLHDRAAAASAAVRDQLRNLATALAEAAADLRATATRATEADDAATAAFRTATQ